MSQSIPPHVRSEHLDVLPSITHGFFGREGGVSHGLYDSLNTGPGSNDDTDRVKENRSIVAGAMGADSRDHLISLYQIHSPNVVTITEPFDWGDRPDGDAMVTNQPGLALCILTADCTPVLIADPGAGVIGAAHAGWKGAYIGIIRKVIKFLIKNGSNAKDLIAVIGPSISQKNYEIQKDFKDKFLKKDKRNKIFFKLIKNKTYFSLNRYIYSQLKKLGINSLEVINKDTFNQKNNFFSARRSIQNNEGDYGRNISIIMIK